MKLKEYPTSLLEALKLKRRGSKKAQNSADAAAVIVSLTSIENRLSTLELTILSLMRQSLPPEKIVLWLENTLKSKTPRSLQSLQGDSFEIRYVEGGYSHRKLVCALQAFPGRTIVTCDDDIMYRENWLRSLLQSHLAHPDHIIAHECRTISANEHGALAPYTDWPTSKINGDTGTTLLPIGYGGVLYPADSLHSDTTQESLFLQLAPKADDLWFKAMSLLAGRSVRKADLRCDKPIPIIGAKGSSLAKTNIDEDGNRKQWQAICNHYGIDPVTLSQK